MTLRSADPGRAPAAHSVRLFCQRGPGRDRTPLPALSFLSRPEETIASLQLQPDTGARCTPHLAMPGVTLGMGSTRRWEDCDDLLGEQSDEVSGRSGTGMVPISCQSQHAQRQSCQSLLGAGKSSASNRRRDRQEVDISGSRERDGDRQVVSTIYRRDCYARLGSDLPRGETGSSRMHGMSTGHFLRYRGRPTWYMPTDRLRDARY